MESARTRRPRRLPTIDTSPDADLIARVRGGDERAFEALFRAYASPLSRLAYHYVGSVALAEEVVQDVFLRLWDGRATLHVTESLPGYLRVAVRNRALDTTKAARSAFRVQRASQTVEPQAPAGMGQPARSPFEDVEHRELSDALRQAVDRLPARCRLVFLLRWESHLSYAEIAEQLDISVKAVERHRQRALTRLATFLRRFRP